MSPPCRASRPSALQARARGLSRILEHRQPQRQQLGHRRRAPEQVHGDDRAHRGRECGAHAVDGDVPSAGVDIAKDRLGTRVDHRLGAGIERERRDHDVVAGTHAECPESDRDRVGAVSHPHHVAHSEVSRELAFERFDLGAEDVLAVLHDLGDPGQDRRAQVRQRAFGIEQGDRHQRGTLPGVGCRSARRSLRLAAVLLSLASVTDSLVSLATHVIRDLGFAGVFVLTMSSGVVGLPGSEPTMLFAGFNVFQGHLSLLGIIIFGVLGDLAGASIAYAIGYYGRVELLERHGSKFHVSPRRLARAHDWFERYGSPVIFVSRLLPLVRLVFPYAAGVARMPFARFIASYHARLDPLDHRTRCARARGEAAAGRAGGTTSSTSTTPPPRF